MSEPAPGKTTTPSTTTARELERGRPTTGLERHPLASLRTGVDRLFDDFFAAMPFGRRDLAADPWRRMQGMFDATFPEVEVAEREKDYLITAELPGMDEKDIDLSIIDGVLTLKGEKREERDDKSGNRVVSERRYGAFQRSFRLPDHVDQEHIDANMKNGVLTVTLQKTVDAQTSPKKIEIKTQQGQ